jgi:hypothetical protein
MSDFRTTPKTTRSWTSYLLASSFAAVSLSMSHAPLGLAAVNSAAARSVAAEAATSLRLSKGAFVYPAIGLDHGVIAVDAVAVGNHETVGMSIGAYDRTPELAPSR